MEVEPGYCQCGCGAPTTIALRDDATHGWLR